MPKSGNPHLRQTILEVVENQLRDGDPPETAATLERLIKEGQSREAAVELIAAALAAEIFNVMKTKTPYDNARYVGRLKQLPDMPWDK